MKNLSFYLILLCLSACAPKIIHIADIDDSNVRIDKGETGVNASTSDLIDPFKQKLDLTMNDVIGQNPVELTKGKPNSGLTNWFADALYAQTQKYSKEPLDFALQNFGGIRLNSLAAGPITTGKMYELMPFDNVMYIMELDSASVFALAKKFVQAEGYPLSHTIDITSEYGAPTQILINGEPLKNRVYYVGIPDYIANGGDSMEMLKGKKFTNTGIFLRDMLIAHVKETKVIEANMKKRMH